MSKSIWVYVELTNGEIAPVTYELLAKATELSKGEGYEIYAILLGNDLAKHVERLIVYGADQVISVDNPILATYKTVPYAQVIAELATKYNPEIFLLGATSQGRDIAPRVQAKLMTGLTADCLDLKINAEGLLEQSKPFYGDNYMCDIICPVKRPQMATVRPKVFKPLEPRDYIAGREVQETVDVMDDTRYEVIGFAPLEKNAAAVDEAERVIGLGAGLDSDGIIAQAKELARLLKAGIGVTRPLTDNGRFAHESQVGQSGLTIAPKVILNLGISGAVQYTVGILNSELIISVDKNVKAPIFRVSDYGYACDINELLPVLVEKAKTLK